MDKEFLVDCLDEGMSTRQIAKFKDVGKSTVSYWIHKYDLQDTSAHARKPPYKFEKIDSKEKAYALGFILADGSISSNGYVDLSIRMVDRKVVEFISMIIGGCVKYSYVFDKKSRRFPNASLNRRTLDITKFTGGYLKKDRHYPRVRDDLERYLLQGVFDADGCITWGWRKDKKRIWQKICFTSQFKILEGVQHYLLNKLNISTAIRPKSDGDCYVLEFSDLKNVLKFCEHIYPDDEFIILDRKYLKYKALRLELEENGGTNMICCNAVPGLQSRRV